MKVETLRENIRNMQFVGASYSNSKPCDVPKALTGPLHILRDIIHGFHASLHRHYFFLFVVMEAFASLKNRGT